ncbi:MAG: cysteine--tRNA ligase [Methanobrevibacter sp.]|uniref:cysteine--tRNA ligase n=1 Tax=Methanobrevibacter sp. TaxID=66852 RepID=UPI0025D6CA32|nr:cysteine--tRNA ligase [Methanobrevibacter sp.]MBR0271885.1 cysteine--tRNA ligase [Methanobrevibacter sp.]
MDIYSTLTRSKENFETINKDRVNLFVCGPTVYDDAHIGHGRTYISFDTIKRYLEYSGYAVFYIQNITDIDDKIINRSKESGIPAHDIARKFEKRYIEDMTKLNVTGVNLFARATDHLGEIIDQIQRLIDKGFAYESEDGVYFEIEKFEEFGKLSNRKVDELESHRELVQTTKRNEQDFALWKKRDGVDEPVFPSPWGDGRPGWHIEDTAITEYYFGEQYDVHGGGLDLIFPHHEAEITQMEAVSGKSPMVRYWLHTGFLNVNGEKMSKSLHNFITIRELLEDWDADTFRFFVLSTHYRSPIDFSKDSLHQSEKSLEKIKKFYSSLDVESGDADSDLESLKAAKNEFFGSMDDDFNTPKAIASIFVLINDCKNIELSENDKIAIKSFLDDVSYILGIDFNLEEVSAGSDELLDLITDVRSQLRAAKQYDLSDKIRDDLIGLGYEIND